MDITKDKRENNVASNIAKNTHVFWETLAVLAGLFLVFHGLLSVIYLDQSFIFRFFSWCEVLIGMATIAVDMWFLTHI